MGPATLVLNRERSGRKADHLWVADFDLVLDGIAVDGAHVVFRVNYGNLIQFGTEGLPNPGASAGTDCVTPGVGGAGTRAARTQYYHVNLGLQSAWGWYPSNSWLASQLPVRTNLELTCNAFWDGSSLNFYRSGDGCGNTTNGGSTWSVMPLNAFLNGGFTAPVDESDFNPLGGKPAWCGQRIGSMSEVRVDLSRFAGAEDARLRWYEGDDRQDAAAEPNGWYVDSVTIANTRTVEACTTLGNGNTLFADGFESGDMTRW